VPSSVKLPEGSVDLFFWFADGLLVKASFGFGRSKVASMNRVRLLFLLLFEVAEWISCGIWSAVDRCL